MKPSKWVWIAWALVALLFFAREVAIIQKYGSEMIGHADALSEYFVNEAAKLFYDKGPTATAFLPQWPGFDHHTNSPKLLENQIYSHYFPGPEILLYFGYAVFGKSDTTLQWFRLVPLLLALSSVMALSLAMAKWVFPEWKWGQAVVLPWLLFVPAWGYWTLQIHGQSYATTTLIWGLVLGLWSSDEKFLNSETPKWPLYLTGFVLGFLSHYFLLTFCFVLFASPWVAQAFSKNPANGKLAFRISFFIGLGLVAAFVVHLWQIAVFLESWNEALHEQLYIAFERGANVRRADPPDIRIRLIGQYSQHVYSFFNISSLSMLVIGTLASWLHYCSNELRKSKAISILVAFLASYVWVMVMKNHSIDHPHFNPRIFMLLYVTFIAVVASLVSNRLQYRQ